jgi:hypothetical protein
LSRLIAGGIMDRDDTNWHYCIKCEKLVKRRRAVIFKGKENTPYGMRRIVVCNTCFAGDAYKGDNEPNQNMDQEISFMHWFSSVIKAETKEEIKNANSLFTVATKYLNVEITKIKKRRET